MDEKEPSNQENGHAGNADNILSPLPPAGSSTDYMKEPEAQLERTAAQTDRDGAALSDEAGVDRLIGWKLRGLTLALLFSLFLSTLEISIVSTALVPITDDLKSFKQSSYIITAYLLTYTGTMIIWAKLSDILGRRTCMSTALVIFIVSSGACGGAQTTDQLIVFRAFQGIGGSGILALTFVIIPEMVEPAQYSLFAALTSMTYAISYLMGPLVGGGICDHTTWRWVFLLNLPAGFAALLLLYTFMPAGFPHSASRQQRTHTFSKQSLAKIDFVGAILLFGASACFVIALQEAGPQYAWSSALIIVLLVLTGVFAISFVWWENLLNRKENVQEAVFTWRLMKQRVFMGAVAISFLSGVPFTVGTIQIPQRFQTVSSASALEAGIRLLPFTLCASVGTVTANILASKLQIPPLFILLVGAILQIVGTVLMSTLPIEVVPRVYGYEVVLSVGVGLSLGMLIQFVPQLIRGKDQAVAMGAITQFRAFGGVVGLAVATNALNSLINSRLSSVLTADQLASLLESVQTVATLPPSLQGTVRSAFADGYNLQMRIMIGFSAAQVLALALMLERNARRVA